MPLFQIPVVAGGRLIATLSKASVGPGDYSQKTNWRRERSDEIRREGWLPFSPLPAIANQGVFDAALTCYRLVELTRGDGTKALLGFSRSTVKLFSNTLGTWSTIGSGYSASGKRWQVVTIGGTLVANNSVDLPLYWTIGDATVTPMAELREVGVVSVGRIQENNGFLIIANITEIRAAQLDHWMNGYLAYPIGANVAKAASFTAAVGETTDNYQVTTGGVGRVATLPAVAVAGYGVALYYWLEKIDAGVGHVTTSPVIEDYAVDLGSIGDKALVWWDIVRGKWSAVTFLGGTIPATDPYGIPPPAIAITNQLPWALANGEYGIPSQWAPVFSVYMAAASVTIELPFHSSVFIAGQTRVAVVNGGPLGGTLGGQESTPNGVMVLAVSGIFGKTLTLQVTTDIALTYPRVVQILRWADVSSLVGRYLLQGDSSGITSLSTLREWLVISRTTGIYLGRYTGDPNAPFVFTPAYTGTNVPFWPDAIANVQGDYLLYPARGGKMYSFDGTTWPKLHEVTDAAASLFFTGYNQDDEVFAVDNAITKESFFCYPNKTLAFDYNTPGGTLSQIDQLFNAAAMIHKPGTTDFWFVMAIGRMIKTYGLAFGLVPIQTWFRDGAAVQSVLLYGLWHGQTFAYGAWTAGNQGFEKLMTSLTPVFASQSPDAAVNVELGGTWNPNAAIEQFLVPPESLPTPSGRNYVVTALQAIYFEPKITIVDTNDRDCRFTMLMIEAEIVGGAGVTRSKK